MTHLIYGRALTGVILPPKPTLGTICNVIAEENDVTVFDHTGFALAILHQGDRAEFVYVGASWAIMNPQAPL